MNAKLLQIMVVICAFLGGAPVLADEMSDARSVATQILSKLDQRRNAEIWDSEVSNWFKARMTRDAFLANLTMFQAQFGSPGAQRKLIQQSQSQGDVQSGYKGAVYSFMFSATYPVAKAYEVIVLIREDGKFRISGLYFQPNPN